ncbi:MAG TPA: acyl-CoA dehydrogenase family protein, partial [Burkholderiaceae bacterium]|nr:acyl-CoA dehydrogenase family protein [Burkholderiaceae bacterium]
LLWRQLAGQGLASLGSDAAEGGVRELLLVVEELGRAACPVPMIDAGIANLLLSSARARHVEADRWLSALHRGDAYPCTSWAGADPDRSGHIVLADRGRGAASPGIELRRVSGQVAFVEGASAATHLLAVIGDGAESVAIVDLAQSGVTITPTRAMGADGLCEVSLTDAVAVVVPVAAERVRDLLSVSALAHSARACGAADRAFELAVQYAKERRQFGQPVGRFQAVQHKLANNLIALRAAQASLDNAAAHFDRGIDDWRVFAAAARAFANVSLRQVSLETHHAFGAIGYAEEHEAPRHFKRVHLDVVRHGGGRCAREALAARYLGDAPARLPELDLGPDANAFRLEVRSWLAKHWPPERREAYEQSQQAHRDYDPQFARELGRTGWLGLTWPGRFGGQERTPYELMAFLEEMSRADAPRAGAPIQAAAWMRYGRPDQQQRYLPELLRGEVIYGMWYSEPDSGSDLASIRTRAVRDGDHWVINGQKIWTTTWWGDYMWLAARTDPDAKPPQSGISMFVVRSDTPGITRKPMKTMYDGEFCNTFFDDVRVPADALVGEVGRGWEILTGSLGTERAFVGGVILMKLARQFEELCDHVRQAESHGRPLRHDPVVRDAIGSYAAQIEAGRQLALSCVRLLARGEMPTWEAAVTKVFASELMERFHESALDLLGMSATLSSSAPGAPMRGRLEQKLRHSLMWVISIGSNEIQRSLIAQRGLGLPR